MFKYSGNNHIEMPEEASSAFELEEDKVENTFFQAPTHNVVHVRPKKEENTIVNNMLEMVLANDISRDTKKTAKEEKKGPIDMDNLPDVRSGW